MNNLISTRDKHFGGVGRTDAAEKPYLPGRLLDWSQSQSEFIPVGRGGFETLKIRGSESAPTLALALT